MERYTPDTVIGTDEVLDVLSELVRIPSVNPALDEDGTGEARVADLAANWFRQRGIEASIEEPLPGRPNVVARVGDGNGPTLVLCGHLDTVSARGMTIHPFEPRVDGRRLFGRGSYDMKGGVAAIMAAAAALAGDEPPGTVIAALVSDEEFRSVGASDFVRRHRADGCILTEPSELDLVLAHKGFGWFEIETSGQAAHGSRWDLGESAVGKMGPIIAALEEFDRNVLRTRAHSLTGPASLHCAMIEGGDGWSTYAPRCMLRVERRTIPGEDFDDVEDEIRGLVDRVDPTASIRTVFARPPSSCSRDEAIARCVRASAESVLGQAPREIGVAYWMDAALFAEAGIPAVNIGPSGEGAHAAEEWVDVDSVAACAEILVRSARAFMETRTSSAH